MALQDFCKDEYCAINCTKGDLEDLPKLPDIAQYKCLKCDSDDGFCFLWLLFLCPLLLIIMFVVILCKRHMSRKANSTGKREDESNAHIYPLTSASNRSSETPDNDQPLAPTNPVYENTKDVHEQSGSPTELGTAATPGRKSSTENTTKRSGNKTTKVIPAAKVGLEVETSQLAQPMKRADGKRAGGPV